MLWQSQFPPAAYHKCLLAIVAFYVYICASLFLARLISDVRGRWAGKNRRCESINKASGKRAINKREIDVGVRCLTFSLTEDSGTSFLARTVAGWDWAGMMEGPGTHPHPQSGVRVCHPRWFVSRKQVLESPAQRGSCLGADLHDHAHPEGSTLREIGDYDREKKRIGVFINCLSKKFIGLNILK